MIGEITLHTRRIDFTAGLLLQISVSADMVRVGMRIVDSCQFPSLFIQDFSHPPSGILIASAVDETDFLFTYFYNSNLGRTLHIVAVLPCLI